jgi:hypothetical protein
MMRWTQQLIPPELLGSHIASGISHTTGRAHDLNFRRRPRCSAIWGSSGTSGGRVPPTWPSWASGSSSTSSIGTCCSAAPWCASTSPTRAWSPSGWWHPIGAGPSIRSRPSNAPTSRCWAGCGFPAWIPSDAIGLPRSWWAAPRPGCGRPCGGGSNATSRRSWPT